MKKLFFFSCLFVAKVSIGQVMVLFETDTTDKENITEVAQNWFGAVQKITGDDNGISMHHKGWSSTTVYFLSWYDSMKEMVEAREKQDKMTPQIEEHLRIKPSTSKPLKKFNLITDPRQASVWEYMPEVSQMDDYLNLSQEERDAMQYRRFQYINVSMNSDDAFIEHQKKQYELDEKRGFNYHIAVFKNIFEGKDSDYLTVIVNKTRMEYMRNFMERMKIRRASPDWDKQLNSWDLTQYHVIKTEEVYKNLDFSLLTK